MNRGHIVAVTSVEDGFETVIFHNEGCSYDIAREPWASDDKKRWQRLWRCDLAYEVENVGWETIFPDPDEVRVGYYEVLIEWHRTPGGPWGPAEYDSSIGVRRVGGPE